MNRIILGAGRKVTQTCDVFNIWNEITQFYETPRLEGENKRGIPVLDHILTEHEDYVIHSTDQDNEYVLHSMLGACRDKRDKVNKFTQECLDKNIKYRWGTLIHNTAVFTNPQSIGEDTIIRPLSIICSNVVLENHVDIGNLSNIGHDTVVGEYSVIAGQAALSGGVKLGKGVFIGQGASIKPDIRIGNGAVIGTGAVIVKDVPPNMVVAGNPARHSPRFKGVEPW